MEYITIILYVILVLSYCIGMYLLIKNCKKILKELHENTIDISVYKSEISQISSRIKSIREELHEEIKKINKADYNSIPIRELRKIAKEIGIEKYYDLKKADLVKALSKKEN